MAGLNVGQRLTEMKKAADLELLIVRGVQLLMIADVEDDAAAEARQVSQSRRTSEVQGICIAAATLGLVVTADSAMEMIQRRYVEALETSA